MDNRLYVDMDWGEDLQVGEFLVIECYRKLDWTTFTDINNDIFLKRYVTALFKKQWGANLSKFNGVAMLGGVTLNGQQIYSEALADIEKLRTRIKNNIRIKSSTNDRDNAMPVNHYFQDGKGLGNTAEKRLYEDLIIEGLKIYGSRRILLTKNTCK